MVLVRRATEKDIPGIVDLTQYASVAGVCPGVPMDPETISEFALASITNGAIFVADRGGTVEAACAMWIVPYHFNKHVKVAYGTFLWARVPGLGHKVVVAAEQWAKEAGACKILLTTNDTVYRADRNRSYLETRGYRAEETNFVRPL